MVEKSTPNWVLISIALIGLVGTIAASVISNWEKLSGDVSLEAVVPVQQEPNGEASSALTNQDESTTANPPDLTGTWYVQTTTQETTYNPYRGLVIRYKILITHDGTQIMANGEKIGEVFQGRVHEHTGKGKTPIRLSGFLKMSESGSGKIELNGQEDGIKRKVFATAFSLDYIDDSFLSGTFSSTAANAEGNALWIKETKWLETGWNEG